LCKSQATRSAIDAHKPERNTTPNLLAVVNYTTKSVFAVHVVRCKAMVKNGSTLTPTKSSRAGDAAK